MQCSVHPDDEVLEADAAPGKSKESLTDFQAFVLLGMVIVYIGFVWGNFDVRGQRMVTLCVSVL